MILTLKSRAMTQPIDIVENLSYCAIKLVRDFFAYFYLSVKGAC